MKGEITAKEMGHRGGTSTVTKYPADTRLGWAAKGGQTTKEKYGAEHYRAIQLKGAATKRARRIEKEQNHAQVDILTSQ